MNLQEKIQKSDTEEIDHENLEIEELKGDFEASEVLDNKLLRKIAEKQLIATNGEGFHNNLYQTLLGRVKRKKLVKYGIITRGNTNLVLLTKKEILSKIQKEEEK